MTVPVRISDSESASDIRFGVALTNSLTDLRTNGESWLRTRDLLTFRNARAHIRRFISGGVPA